MFITHKKAWSFAAMVATCGAAHAADSQGIPYRSADPAADVLFANDPTKVTSELSADGSIVYHLNGQGMQAMTATREADGTIHYHCDDAALERVLNNRGEKADEK